MNSLEKTYVRFTVDQRIEHMLLILSFFVLGLTGIPQKFPLSPISDFIIRLLGGIEIVRYIHRFSAFVMMIQSLFHVISTAYRIFVMRIRAGMIPNTKDIFDAIGMLAYNLGFTKTKPKMDRFNFAEKAEYWALVWGTVIMGITGFMMWNPIATTKVLPGQIIPAAKAAHGAEAILAVLAILLWHFYHVHLKDWNWSIFTGKLTRHQMEEEHGAELERIEAPEKEEPVVSSEVREKRQMIFFPVVVIFTIGFLFFVFFFTSYEETAITTLPQADWGVTPYSPQTNTPIPTPTFTAVPTQSAEDLVTEAGGLTWEADIAGMLQNKCGSCHGTMGGLSVETYDALLTGGNNGPAIVPGDPTAGTLISVQEDGKHAGQLTNDELAILKSWIAEGALSAGGEAPAAEVSSEPAALTWTDKIGAVFADKCISCHGTMGGLSLETYDGIIAGGAEGPAIVPGDPSAGALIPLMESGSHFAQLTDEELGWVKDWVSNGAPE